MNSNKKKNMEPENDEVEAMLRQAEDAVMLKLSVNSHMAHITDHDLDPDLDHRFQTLKSGSSSARKPNMSAKKSSDLESVSQKSSSVINKDEVDPDDLLARFSALKASLAKPSSSGSSSSLPASNEANNSDQFKELNADGKCKLGNEEEEDVEDGDEVEKVIRWAMDAAQLDPSPLSDDDDLHSYDSDDNDDSSGDEGCDNRKKNKQRDIKKYTSAGEYRGGEH